MVANLVFLGAEKYRRIGRAYDASALKLKDWRPAWKRLLPHLADGLRDNINSQGGRLGRSWAPLTMAWRRRKQRLGKGRAPLVFSGKLLSLVSSPRRGKRSLTKKRLKFGPNKKYQFVQHFGDKRGNLPEREYIAWNTKMDKRRQQIMDQHMVKALLGIGKVR